MNIQFKILETISHINDENLFNEIYVTATIDNQPVGFSQTHYISKDIFEKKLSSVVKFFIYKINQGNAQLQKSFEQNEEIVLVKMLKSFGNNWAEIQNNINKQYSSNYNKFIQYWVNKPTQKLIYVLDENDHTFTEIVKSQKQLIDIKSQNNRGKNIGKLIMKHVIHHLSTKNLFLWESSTQTESGKKLWKNTDEHFFVEKQQDRSFAFL